MGRYIKDLEKSEKRRIEYIMVNIRMNGMNYRLQENMQVLLSPFQPITSQQSYALKVIQLEDLLHQVIVKHVYIQQLRKDAKNKKNKIKKILKSAKSLDFEKQLLNTLKKLKNLKEYYLLENIQGQDTKHNTFVRSMMKYGLHYLQIYLKVVVSDVVKEKNLETYQSQKKNISID